MNMVYIQMNCHYCQIMSLYMYFSCIYSLTFAKSYDSGRSMPTVAKGLLSGGELVEKYSSTGKKKKIYFFFDESGMICYMYMYLFLSIYTYL